MPEDRQQKLIRIPLTQIRPSKGNRVITQEMIDTRAASMADGGQALPITVRPLPPDEIDPAYPEAVYEIIDGEVRYRAALKLGHTEINVIETPMGPREAFKHRIRANRINKPGWFEDYLYMEELANESAGPEKMNNQQIADLFEVQNSIVTRAIKIMDVLSDASRDLIFQNLKSSQKIREIRENVLYRLADLGKSTAVDAALPMVLEKGLTEPQTQELVQWLQDGKALADFNPSARPPSTGRKPKAQKTHLSPLPKGDSLPTPELQETGHAHPSDKSEKLESSELGVGKTIQHPSPAKATSAHTAKPSAEPQTMGAVETVVMETLAGVSLTSKIKTKVKKGERPTSGERLLLWAHGLWEITHKIGKPVFDIFKKLGKELWHLFKGVLKDLLGLLSPNTRKIVKVLMAVILIFAMLWAGWKLYEHLVLNPLHWITQKLFHHAEVIPATPVPTPVETKLEVRSEKLESLKPSTPTKTKLVVRSEKVESLKAEVDTSTHPWNPADEDQNYLEAELAALPSFCVIKPFAFAPESMGAEMANHRLADLTNNEIYSMKIGHNTQKVMSVVPTSTDLTITYQGDLVGGFLDGSSKMEIYWEDLKAIHTDEINAGTTVVYQLSLVVADAKQPLIIQCASARDLEHLVAVTNYFLKASGLASVPLAGLPYLNQGLCLNNDRQITALWADSPADQAGLKLKDYLWSLETNWPSQENKTQLETGLQAFTAPLRQGFGGQAVTHYVYVVASAAWEKAINQNKNNNTAYGFNPKRDRVKLVTPE